MDWRCFSAKKGAWLVEVKGRKKTAPKGKKKKIDATRRCCHFSFFRSTQSLSKTKNQLGNRRASNSFRCRLSPSISIRDALDRSKRPLCSGCELQQSPHRCPTPNAPEQPCDVDIDGDGGDCRSGVVLSFWPRSRALRRRFEAGGLKGALLCGRNCSKGRNVGLNPEGRRRRKTSDRLFLSLSLLHHH